MTIVLWLAAGVDLAFRYQAIQREVGGLTDRFVASEQALADLRTSVLLGAIDWRDALLDSGGPERTDYYLAQMRRYQQVCAASIAELERSGQPAGRIRIAGGAGARGGRLLGVGPAHRRAAAGVAGDRPAPAS